MKSSLSVLLAVLLGCFLTACGRAKVAAPAPNVAGQWQWSNDLLGAWQLDLKADGTFQRVIVKPRDPIPLVQSGRWVVSVPPPKHRLFQKSDVDDELLRTAGVDEKDQTIQWSAPGTLALFYNAPPDTELASGAAWNGITHTQSDDPASPVEREIEEKHPIRTHTNTKTGEVFLDLEGKAFQTRPGKIQTAAPIATATPAPQESDYLAISPFPGVRLEMPSTWQAINPDAAEMQPLPATTFSNPSRETKPNGVWRFVPPGQADEAYIVVAVQPSILSVQQLTDSSEINLERFAAGFVKGATHALDGKGFFLEPNVKAERTKIGERSALLCTSALVDPEGNRRAIRAYAIPTEAATIVLVYCWDTTPGKPWKAMMERVWTSPRVGEK